MSDPIKFLNAFAHAVTTLTLYPVGHPSREGAVDAAYDEVIALYGQGRRPTFTFIDDQVIFGREPLRELKAWDFGTRLIRGGIQRIEFERLITRDEFDEFLIEILARLTQSAVDSSAARQMRSLGVRFGGVGLGTEDTPDAPATTLDLALGDEADAFRAIHASVQSGSAIPVLEAESVVWSLAVAMHSDRKMVLPLLQLKEFDQYTTTHSLNVSVLAMALAEALGYGPKDVRAIGVSGLLHDMGKVKIPLEVLTKPGKLSEEERRIMNQHPVDGAKIILKSGSDMELAATVAYEHHVMINGGGYPKLHYKRECLVASRLVHVCDVYDALCTKRPYREAWSSEKTLVYLESRAGEEFDGDIVATFARTLRAGTADVKVLREEKSVGVASA